jgi:hypothetical protein
MHKTLAWLCFIERRNPRRPESRPHLVLQDHASLDSLKSGWTRGAAGVCPLCGMRHVEARREAGA